MPIEPILDEVELLHAIGARLEGLAEHHTKVTEELMATAGSVRNTATVLAVLVKPPSYAAAMGPLID